MQSKWDEKGRRVLHADGTFTFVPYLSSSDQVARWTSAGFDLAGAAARSDALLARFRAAPDFDSADQILQDHFAAETKIVLAEGVAPDDADLYRIETSARAYEFSVA